MVNWICHSENKSRGILKAMMFDLDGYLIFVFHFFVNALNKLNFLTFADDPLLMKKWALRREEDSVSQLSSIIFLVSVYETALKQ